MTAPDGILLDTTVLVDLLRGREEAQDYLISLQGEVGLSVLTVAELFAGARRSDALPVSKLVSLFRPFPVSTTIAQLAGMHRHQFGTTHGTSLVDALIGATAIVHNQCLVTHNTRHFPMLEEHQIQVPYPA